LPQAAAEETMKKDANQCLQPPSDLSEETIKKNATQRSQHKSDPSEEKSMRKARRNQILFGKLTVAVVLLWRLLTAAVNLLMPVEESQQLIALFLPSSRSHGEICADVSIQQTESHWREKKPGTVWMPGFPGSGSELMRQLIEAITVLPANLPTHEKIKWQKAGNVYSTRRGSLSTCLHAVTCKTHWPVFRNSTHHDKFREDRLLHNSRPLDEAEPAIFLVRHPLLAIPSWYNYQYEDSIRNNTGTSTHAHQAPQPMWEKWRDNQFRSALERWAQIIERWFDTANAEENFRFQVHYVIAYEHLTSHGLGEDYENCFRDILPKNETNRVHAPCVGMGTLHDFALTLSRLGHDLIYDLPLPMPSFSQGVGTLSMSQRSPPLWIRCLWDKFVLHNAGSKKRQRGYEPTFTVPQYKKVCSELKSLAKKPFLREASGKQLKSILRGYIKMTPNCTAS
jgi:hypothetical protein